MGLRATVIKKYEVEFGEGRGFNYDPGTLANILTDFSDNVYTGDDGYGGCSTDAYWEVPKEHFQDMVKELEAMSEEEFDRRLNEDWFEGWGDKYKKEELVKLFRSWLEQTPEKYDFVRIGWL